MTRLLALLVVALVAIAWAVLRREPHAEATLFNEPWGDL